MEIKLCDDAKEPYAVIYTQALTDEVQAAVTLLEQKRPSFLVAKKEDGYVVVDPNQLFMVRVENEKTVLYCEKTVYTSEKRLYELENFLGDGFMRISKAVIVNLRQIESIEPSFNGMLYLCLKNGAKDYISRNYLPAFKKYFGL